MNLYVSFLTFLLFVTIPSCKSKDNKLTDMDKIASIDGLSPDYREKKSTSDFDSIVTYVGFRDYPYIKDSFKMKLFFWDSHLRGYIHPKLRSQNIQVFGEVENDEIFIKTNPKLGDRERGGGFSIKHKGSQLVANYYQLEENRYTPITLQKSTKDFHLIFK